ncbi:MAG: hypothetical protein JW725_05060 [Candidatus Babeliaceae bacterium]|nr:hypothetical protein [Candidatus Babeliaceae bacterium]
MSTTFNDTYRSKKGKHYFKFRFVPTGGVYDVYCDSHPGFNGKDNSPRKTHLFHSGKLCFQKGKEPRTPKRARELAGQWAEYMAEYRRTGIAQY